MYTILCFYHSPCNDGSAAAAALNYRLNQAQPFGGTFDIRFCPLTFTTEWNEPFHDGYLENEVQPRHQVAEIYFVDISVSVVKYRQLEEHLRAEGQVGITTPRVVCIDHHKTALNKIEELEEFCDETYIHMGEGLSGATLVWKYFDERLNSTLPMPALFRYVADQDIWEWKLKDSKAINTALNVLDGRADTMIEELAWSMGNEDDWYATRRKEGEAILKMTEAQIHKSALHVREYDIEGVNLRLVNATENSSELGNYLCQHSPAIPHAIAVIYSVQENFNVKCSVRSVDGGKTTARNFAERYGGGGHDNAAGCRFESLELLIAAIEELERTGWGT